MIHLREPREFLWWHKRSVAVHSKTRHALRLVLLTLAGCTPLASESPTLIETPAHSHLASSGHATTGATFFENVRRSGLFTPNHAWSVRGTMKHQHFDGVNVVTHASFEAACTVTAVARLSWGSWAVVLCDPLPDAGASPLLGGSWIATHDGLYHTREIEIQSEVPPAAQLILPNQPTAKTEQQRDPDTGFGSKTRVYTKRESWCFEHTSWAGDEAWQFICIGEGQGLVSGEYGWAGGSSDAVSLTLRSLR